MLALVSFGVYRLYFASTGRAAIVEITVDGNVYKTLSLKEDATVDVPSDGGHTNTVQIKDGKVFMKKADCPDKICVHHKGIRSNGESNSNNSIFRNRRSGWCCPIALTRTSQFCEVLFVSNSNFPYRRLLSNHILLIMSKNTKYFAAAR